MVLRVFLALSRGSVPDAPQTAPPSWLDPGVSGCSWNLTEMMGRLAEASRVPIRKMGEEGIH